VGALAERQASAGIGNDGHALENQG
jgi:hypothetical protein